MILAECDRLYMCRARVKIATSVYYITCVHTIYLPYFTCTYIYEGTFFVFIFCIRYIGKFTKFFIYIIQMYFILRIFFQSQKELRGKRYYYGRNCFFHLTIFLFYFHFIVFISFFHSMPSI